MKHTLPTLALLSTVTCLAAAGCAPTPPAEEAVATTAADVELPAGAEKAAAAITREALETPIRALSDDAMEGRGPATAGDAKAQQYLVDQMTALGLEAAGPNGAWRQPVPVVSVNAQVPTTWTFDGGSQPVTLTNLDEFVAFSGVQEDRAVLDDAELVFVGYGIEAPEYEWDDFKGADLSGKVLVMLNNDPDWDPELFAGETRLYYGRWTYKFESAARQGAAGAIVIHTTPSAGYPWQVVRASWTGPQFELAAEGEPRLQVGGWVSEEAATEILSAAGQDLAALTEAAHQRDFTPVPLGITTSFELTTTIERVETANVVGRLPGGDLADEYVVYTAHHDHFGIGEPNAEGDAIYNGALDNAGGVGQVLAVAEALTQLPEPPRRSILFLFVAVEEQGLLGSKYWAAHPTVPPGKVAANINIDGANIWGETRDVTLVGYGKSSLDAVAQRFAKQQGRELKPDQFPDKGFYYRSDQFSLAKIGIPALYFDAGTDFVGQEPGWGKKQVDEWTEVHYHQPSDEVTDEWVWDGMIQDTRLAYYCGLAVAQADTLPAWNPGDEFEAARMEALAAVE
jgi:Zn-dependent M28 family amino/carboxypeptidase